ncbi:cytochrome P450 2D10 isoform X2 [Magallana gigas]|uniref:cytochrome P450 2D10 isoform X2 n=1 Tax=Magallana gigas TaxID=29159 RepID=UPI003341616E
MLEIITVIAILLFTIYHYCKKTTSGLPGPVGPPFFGVIFRIDFSRLHLRLYEWTTKYGDIFQFSVLGKSYISLNSAEIIREVLGTEPNATITSSREPSFFGEYCMENYSDIAFSPIDKEWTKRRKLVHKLLHSYGEGIQLLEDEVLKKLKNVKRYVAENGNKDLDPHYVVEEFLFENLASLVAGTTDKQLQMWMKEMDETANEIASPIVDLMFRTFPVLLKLPFSITKKPSYCKNTINEVMNSIRKISIEKDIKQGMYYEIKNGVEKHGHLISEKEIKGIFANVIGGGFLTSRGTLMSLIYLLAEYQTIQKKIQHEIDDVVGEREAHVTDRHSCPLTEAFLLETLRYIAHAPLSLPHYASETCSIRGHTIEKGTTILTNLWTVLHSNEWGDPFTFRPDRFLDESGLLLPASHPIC